MLLGSKRTSFETKWPSSSRHLLLKEDIRKAEGFAKAGMKNYDNRTEELKVLKAQLKEAESNFREAERELMIINPMELTEEVTSETAVTGLVLDKFCRTADGDEGGKHQLISPSCLMASSTSARLRLETRWFKGANKFVEDTATSFTVA